jgi:hypothetical protein
MQHNHNPDATWETKLVIPEAVKSVEERTLDVLLEISASLEKLRVDFLRTRREQLVEVEKDPAPAAKKAKAK